MEYNNEESLNNQSIEDIQYAIVKPIEKSKKKTGKNILVASAIALGSFGLGGLCFSVLDLGKQEVQLTTANTSNTINEGIPTGVQKTNLGGSLSIAQIAELAKDSVVEITTETMTTSSWMGQFVQSGAGSGVITTSDGYIVTNNHVIDGANKITVRLNNGEEYEAKLIGTDAQTDLAVIKIDKENLSAVTLGDSDTLKVGELAVAIGNPLGQLGGTVTNGIISALDREITIDGKTMNLLQTNAAINPGNSGGGLFNDSGELIGIVVAKSAGSDVEGLGFVIPSNDVKVVVEQLINHGYVQGRPMLGVSVVDITSAQKAMQFGVRQMGIYIADFEENSKAAKAGLQVGDCIVAINNKQITSTGDITSILQESSVGDLVEMTLSRNGQMVNVQLELSEYKPSTGANQTQE